MTSLYQQTESEFFCDHPQSEIRLKHDSLNRPQYLYQCLTCGSGTSIFVKKSTIPDVNKIQTWDYTLEESWQHQKKQYREKLIDQHNSKQGEFWDRYNAYLLTPEWRMKRLKVLERDNYLCQGCLENQANEVHHLTYDHVFNEFLFELTSVCNDCHDRIHAK